MPGARRWLTSFAPLALATAALAVVATRAVLERTAGEPALPLDDAFIHFQYARSFARLEPFVYSEGAEPAPGATSLLWPLLLSPFVALGFGGTKLVWVAWAFGWLALGLLIHETHAIARGLLSREVAVGAALMVLAFGGYAWCAGSGMEVVPFAWLLMRSARRAADWAEAEEAPSRRELWALGWLTPLLRPEGSIASLLISVVLLLRPRGARRVWALVPLIGPLLAPLVNWLFTGQATSTTVTVKWLPSSPYYDAPLLFGTVASNIGVLFRTLFDGRLWSASVLPSGGAVVAWLALPAIVVAGVRRRRAFRAAAVVAVALGILLPATYDSFLWNRLRYLWPFAAAWFVGLAAVADLVGALAARIRPELETLRVLAAGFFAGALAGHTSFAIDDLAVSSDAIRRQQVALGRWAGRELPENALIGVNDTGAIAYFSERRTFDIVGLTTRGEGRFWVAGAGARFEHYERLGAARLPTHFIVYPEWMAIPELLGERLTERSVPGATILGGTTMVAYRADYSRLGSGELPAEPPAGALHDRLDVADLESEAAHRYELERATQADCIVISDGNARSDGGRTRRTRERFELELPRGGVIVARVGATAPAELSVHSEGRPLGKLRVAAEPWQEVQLKLPPDLPAGRRRLEIRAPGDLEFTAMQYWTYRGSPQQAAVQP